MKKLIAALLCLTCLTAGTALAESLEMEGTIQPGKRLLLTAPYSGMADSLNVSQGDVLAAGDALVAISTQKVYADFDGTVTGVFAQAGDNAASVTGRYGALLYMEREALYTAQCTTSGAAADNENKIIHAGETVYVRSSADSKRDGVARVTGVSGKSYTLEVLLEDGLKIGDTVKVYRDDGFDTDSCIGTGKLNRIDPVAVTADGSVLCVHVKNGQTVSRGDVLLEMVPDALRGMKGGDGTVVMPQDGVLLELYIQGGERVENDQVLAAYCPAGELKIVCSVDEEDLSLIAVGDEFTVTFEATGDKAYDAEVTKIAAAADEKGEFAVTLTLEKTEGLRIGMSATATK
ncbi:MAG: HlyD family efflux transporter periplasmic adaptor subunit [Clostridia bacterium]|nr:HlyD family efflux transporter periplasmic adaptor subunit [Clostridia bacterium]